MLLTAASCHIPSAAIICPVTATWCGAQHDTASAALYIVIGSTLEVLAACCLSRHTPYHHVMKHNWLQNLDACKLLLSSCVEQGRAGRIWSRAGRDRLRADKTEEGQGIYQKKASDGDAFRACKKANPGLKAAASAFGEEPQALQQHYKAA